ncbi:hypothetical protein OGR47_11750 [Methylocystis sp. MJC1]|jgi:hypothetical protein|nr:hypothetical protein [Methylocystis sp. MJC1]KAF2990090.1 hypothetical protein MJC1_02750 [Methylocystis sp. MJC1]UZX10590.1 hypothetical protein OGR47_11750 [Methylocystis sp. MJC1]
MSPVIPDARAASDRESKAKSGVLKGKPDSDVTFFFYSFLAE